MKYYRIEDDTYFENTYIIYENKTALIVDPGKSFERIVAFLEEHELIDIHIYLTHGHFDHIYSVNDLVEKYSCNVYAHEEEIPLLADPKLNLSAKINEDILINNVIGLKDELKIFEQPFKMFHVPGHTQGHSMIEVAKLKSLFVGDFIFKNEIGRCDLPTANFKKMLESLDNLKTMNPQLAIFPGHGDSTTLKDELANNKYLNRN